jgi:hypothetical protein
MLGSGSEGLLSGLQLKRFLRIQVCLLRLTPQTCRPITRCPLSTAASLKKDWQLYRCGPLGDEFFPKSTPGLEELSLSGQAGLGGPAIALDCKGP